MAIKKNLHVKGTQTLRDLRPFGERVMDAMSQPFVVSMVMTLAAVTILMGDTVFAFPSLTYNADWIVFACVIYFVLYMLRPAKLPINMPSFAKVKMKKGEKPEGILFIGNDKDSNEQLWLSNSDARTHILFLGTTGAGKTEGLKSLATNALTWASGFVYVDGKADTDLWASIYALARRFGRDDDMLVLNYMTGNVDDQATSNTMNPFSAGSASFATNLLVSLMPEAGSDNAMWKERAIALIAAIMPAMTWKRDHQGLLLSVGVIRDYLGLNAIVKLSRDPELPPRIAKQLNGFLDTLPGFQHDAYDDEGRVKPPSADGPQYDLSVAEQQHGYLSMQFTRALSSLADDYGYIFNAQIADVEMLDVVLNRRILIVLIPALEKSPDEAANLGKMIAASIKGMMGTTLGANVEGAWSGIIDNKATRSNSPFMTIFDEVGYYTSQGMAVMAAQARSLGFSLVFAAQDLPAMEKRIKQEANSITANCNIKIFGKLEDPTTTKEFFEKTVGKVVVARASGFATQPESMFGSYFDRNDASIQVEDFAYYDETRGFKQGEVVMTFGSGKFVAKMFYAAPKKVKSVRVQRMLCVDPGMARAPVVDDAMEALIRRLSDHSWTAASATAKAPIADEIAGLTRGFAVSKRAGLDFVAAGAMAIAGVADRIREKQEAEEARRPISLIKEQFQDDAPMVKVETRTVADDFATSPFGVPAGDFDSPVVRPSTTPLSWADIVGQAQALATAARDTAPVDAPPYLETLERRQKSDSYATQDRGRRVGDPLGLLGVSEDNLSPAVRAILENAADTMTRRLSGTESGEGE